MYLKKRFLIIAILLVAAVVARAENVVSLNSPSGAPGDTVEVLFSMSCTDACVAMQARIPLGENLHYVANSAVLMASRISDHSLTATVLRDTLLIYSYSLSLTPYSGSGELLRFKLVLGSEPGDYPLVADDLILSDAAYNSLSVTASQGTLTVLAPKIALSASSIDFGHYPIRAEYMRNVTVSNIGNMPMTVSGITFNDTTLSCNEGDVEIAGGASANFTIRYNPVKAGVISRTATIHSTSAVGDSMVAIAANPFAVNELHIDNASGYTDSIITIYLRMNNMDSIVGVQTSLKLPRALTYIDGSFAVAGGRSQGHLAAAGLMGDTLTMLIYNPQNKPLMGDDGIIASFQVRLFGYNYYYLTPLATVLSDTNEQNVVSAVYNGRVQIYSPYLNSATSLDMGSSPLPDPVTKPFAIRNTGNATLIIDNVVFTADGFSVADNLPLSLAPYAYDTLHVVYSGLQEGNYGCTMRIYSNDANNTMRNIAVSGIRYEPNAFYVETDDYYFPEEDVEVRFMLENYSNVTALQFDYSYPAGNYTAEQGDFALTDRANGQSISTVRLNDSTFRVLVFSMQNSPFHGNEGAVATVTLHPIDTTILGTYYSYLNNVLVSNVAGDNKLTDLTATEHFLTHSHCTDTIASDSVICHGDDFVFYSEQLTETGVYEHRIIDNVCDTLYIVDLTVNPSYMVPLAVTICEGSSYEFDGDSLDESGEYTASGITTEGCDSTVTLTLSVVSNYETVDSIDACDQYTWIDGVTYTEDNNSAVYETTASSGCDSTVTLHLTLHHSVSVTDPQEVCDSLVWIDGNSYTDDNNTAYYVAQTEYGCDSVITLDLTVHYSVTTTESVTSDSAYIWNGTLYSESGEYEYHATTEWGCDSTALLVLTIISTEGIDDITITDDIKVYARGRNIIIEAGDNSDVIIYDVMGRIIHKGRIEAPIHVNNTGVYMVKIGNQKPQKVVVR